MRRLGKSFQKTIVLILKMTLFVLLFAAFFFLFGIPNPQLLRISRTSGVTILTFVFVFYGMVAAYGTYDIGKRKSKPIIYSLYLAILITDVVTYIQLSIMNTNDKNNATFKMEDFGLFILVVLVQFFLIVVLTYFGNFVFFKINRPERSCIITSSQNSLNHAYKGVSKYKKQYSVEFIIDYKSPDLKKVILNCDTVFLYDVPVKDRTEIVEFCYRNLRNIYFNPEIVDIVEINAEHLILDDISFVSAPVKELSLEQRLVKRLIDILVSGLALIITSPLWIICMISIKICDGGTILFKQKRATKDGRVFEVYKFRTMKENCPEIPVVEGDERITSVGRVLRKFRLDEIPQFLNIIKGEMSIVGPRPEMIENIYDYTKVLPEFSYRLRVKAGLTGYAQIAGKYNTTPRDKLILDLMYIENYSIWRDLKLMLQTFIVFFKSDSTEAFTGKVDVMFKEFEDDHDI